MTVFTIMKKIIWLGGNEHVTDTTQPGTEVTLCTNAHITSEKYGQLQTDSALTVSVTKTEEWRLYSVK